MDNQITIQELKDKVKKFCEDRDWDQYHNAKDLAIGITTEASELLEHFRFKSEEDIKEILKSKKQKVSEELADVFYFVLRLAQKYDIDLAKELGEKLRKNELKYPIRESKGSNKKYNEL
ncbi:nucleotide pyrophosphohydrolase [Candidatus Woesearchaeota archaeon]|nr:nucleotide pyrophosphohydrolase [Candidatus Woesearchaeota archaeon]